MAQRLLLVALCAVIAVQLISSVEGARKSGCIKRCNDGCRNKHTGPFRLQKMKCLEKCLIYPKNCHKCKKGDSKCYGCLPGYGLSMGTCIPCPVGCKCVEPNICQSCLPGYIMASGVCKACPAVCASCDSTTGKCTCKSGYIASATYDPTKPTTTGPPCLACSANCDVCQQNGPGQCDTCKKGFLSTPVNGVCQACGANCKECTSAGSCDTCNPGYKLISSSAQRTCTACPAHCSSCDTFGPSICDTCIEGYGLSSDHKSCIACADNCLSCHTAGYGKCDPNQCAFGTFTTDGTNTCGATTANPGTTTCDVADSATDCKYCNVINKFWDSTGLACSAEPSPCTDSDCLFCGYVATEAQCFKCDTKLTPTTASTTCGTLTAACSPTQLVLYPNCKECSGTGSNPLCTECKKGYHRNADGSCTPCIANCAVCESSATACDKCAATYNLRADKMLCSKCHQGCGTTDCVSGGGCDSYCIDGYKLSGGTCTACAPGCKSCLINGQGKCDDQQCKTGFTLTAEGKCAKA